MGTLATEVESLRDQLIAKDIIILELEKQLVRYGRLEDTVNSLLVNEHDPDAPLHEQLAKRAANFDSIQELRQMADL